MFNPSKYPLKIPIREEKRTHGAITNMAVFASGLPPKKDIKRLQESTRQVIMTPKAVKSVRQQQNEAFISDSLRKDTDFATSRDKSTGRPEIATE